MNTIPMVRKEVVDSLRSIPLFNRVSEGDLEELATHLIERRFPKNATVVEEGLPGDYMYAIREGRVKVGLLYTSPSPRDATLSRMPSSA